MKKRIIAAALVFTLVLTCLAACGKTAAETEEDKLLGSWLNSQGLWLSLDRDEDSGNYTFTLSLEGYDGGETGIFTADGTNITMTYSTGLTDTIDYTVDGSELSMNKGRLVFTKSDAGVSDVSKLTGLQILSYSIVGFLTVFAVLIILFAVITMQGKVMDSIASKKKPAAQADSEAAPKADEDEIKLINVDDETAAMVMAIVADESGIPLEELYFKSIKLVEGEENK